MRARRHPATQVGDGPSWLVIILIKLVQPRGTSNSLVPRINHGFKLTKQTVNGKLHSLLAGHKGKCRIIGPLSRLETALDPFTHSSLLLIGLSVVEAKDFGSNVAAQTLKEERRWRSGWR